MEAKLAGLIQTYGYGLVGGVLFFESMGVPLPGESLLIAAALYAATTGGLDIGWVVLAAIVGAVLGDNAGYLIGRGAGARVLARYGGRVGLTEHRLRLGRYLFARYGGVVVFFGRFVAFLRTFAALMAGANRMPWGRFLVWNALGGIVWAGGYGFGAYLLGGRVHAVAGPVGFALAAAAAAALGGAVLFVRRHEARLQEEAERAIAAEDAARVGRRPG